MTTEKQNPADLAGGLTWGHDEFLADPATAPVWRIDLVLFRGARFVATQAETIDIALDRTQPPLWASDHAAVAARVEFQPGPNRLRLPLAEMHQWRPGSHWILTS